MAPHAILAMVMAAPCWTVGHHLSEETRTNMSVVVCHCLKCYGVVNISRHCGEAIGLCRVGAC